jgi:hypothetical protein
MKRSIPAFALAAILGTLTAAAQAPPTSVDTQNRPLMDASKPAIK